VAEAVPFPRMVRFGTFEVDLQTGELRKAGQKLKFSGQPFQVLAILLERPGEVVTREELQKRLWPDTFVDVDHNLNTAINKIREVLGDASENPKFVETLPRKGYRFIARFEALHNAAWGAPLAFSYVAKGRYPEAIATLKKCEANFCLGWLAHGYGLVGQKRQAQVTLNKLELASRLLCAN
jgi:DNA-binding winged helix-turn-helix (wHTH) protein